MLTRPYINPHHYTMLAGHNFLLFGSFLLCLSFYRRLKRSKRIWRALGNVPAYFVLVSPFDGINHFLLRIPRILDGPNFSWRNVYDRVFAVSKSDIVQLWSVFRFRAPRLLVADATAAKGIFQNRTAFPRLAQHAKALEQAAYGPSIVGAEHNEWREHRRLVAPSFNEKNNALVWESTIKTVLGYFIKWNRDGRGSIVRSSDFKEVTTQMALMVFSIAGFGINVDWDWDKTEIPKGHNMSFIRALTAAIEGLALRITFPRWYLRWIKRGREAIRGHEEAERYMLEMIANRKDSGDLEQRRDLLSSMIRSSIETSDSQKDFDPTHRNLLGNVFVFLVVGHETVASSLSFAIALLATHQKEQEELYEHVRSVVPVGRLPTYEDVPRLTRVLAVMNETLRLFPPGGMVFKRAVEDSVIPTDSGEMLPVPRGTLLVPMINAMHHNPKYWPDPHEFRPSRFLGDYNKDAFIPFSGGVRGCIGRRWSEIEEIAALSVIILHYKITVLEEPRYAHETTEERKKRVLTPELRFTLMPTRVPVEFTPREGASIQFD